MMSFKQWLNEVSTLPQLDVKARQAFPHTKKRQNDVGSVTSMPDMFFHPTTGVRPALTIDAKTRSRSGNVHSQRIVLYNVQLGDENAPNAVALPGTKLTIVPVSLNKDDARVACDCLDFRFRFAGFNHSDDSLAGNPPPRYIPVPGSNRGPANPSKLPGICKHLMRTVQTLKQKGIVT